MDDRATDPIWRWWWSPLLNFYYHRAVSVSSLVIRPHLARFLPVKLQRASISSSLRECPRRGSNNWQQDSWLNASPLNYPVFISNVINFICINVTSQFYYLLWAFYVLLYCVVLFILYFWGICQSFTLRLGESLPNPRTLSHKSSFIPRTYNLWNILPPCFPESYNLPSFKSKINKLDPNPLSS